MEKFIIFRLFWLLFVLSAVSARKNSSFLSRTQHLLRHTPEDVELTTFFTHLWNSDEGKTSLGSELQVDIGGQTTDRETEDKAPRNLFTVVDETSIFSHPTVAALLKLHDNYKPRASAHEDQEHNHHELAEIRHFLNLVMNSQTMLRAKTFLQQLHLLSNNSLWSDTLHHIWFDLYSRHRGVRGSSGFEHVFLGEIDDGKVKGSHNWIWFYEMEKKGKIDYQGYLSAPTSNPFLMSLRFNWPFENHIYKKAKTSFIMGSSPEFDMALFTVCFIKHPNAVSKFQINGQTFMVQSWKNQDGTLGSAYFLG